MYIYKNNIAWYTLLQPDTIYDINTYMYICQCDILDSLATRSASSDMICPLIVYCCFSFDY